VREAFLIHYRNLIDFVYQKKKWPTDAVAIDYIADWAPKRPSWLSDERERCHKLLAHLTYERVTYEEHDALSWDLDEKVSQLRAVWNGFLSALPDASRPWFS
jgi:hypothetical protein